MTADGIASVILNSMNPEARKSWRSEVRADTVWVELVFRSAPPVYLDIKAVAECFHPVRDVSWQDGRGDDRDSPCVMFRGWLGGKSVQARFVLADRGDPRHP
jgi:hypothetical protein